MGRAAIAAVLAAGLAATASGAGTPQATALRITYRANGAASTTAVRWTLGCSPPRGTLPAPAAACRRLARGGPRLFAPVPPGVACTQIYGGPQVALVTGVVSGTRIWARFSREDGCQTMRWNRLSPWLLPRGGVP